MNNGQLEAQQNNDRATLVTPFTLETAIGAISTECTRMVEEIGMIREVNDKIFGINEEMVKKFQPDNQTPTEVGSTVLIRMRLECDYLSHLNEQLRCEIRRYQNIIPNQGGLQFTGDAISCGTLANQAYNSSVGADNDRRV